MTREELTFESQRKGTAPADREMRAKAFEALSSDTSRANYTKQLAGQKEQELETRKKNGEAAYKDMTPEEIKKSAVSQAMLQSDTEAADHIDEARKLHESLGNMDKVKELDGMKEKNPELEKDAAKREQLYTKIKNDIEKVKAMSPEGISSGRNLMGIMPEGAFKKDGLGRITGVDQAKVDAFKEQHKENRNLVANVDALVGHIKATPGMGDFKVMGAKFQRDNRGNMRLYDGFKGGRMRSGDEERALAALETNIGSATNKGRDASGKFSPAAAASFKQGIQNLPLDEAVSRADAGKGDKATTNGLNTLMADMIEEAQKATSDTQRNEVMRPLAKIASEMGGPNITSDIQVSAIAGLRNGGDGSKFIAGNVDKMSHANKEAIVKMIQIALAREKDILGKASADRSAQENEVVTFLEDLRTAVPVNSKHILRNHIHGT